MLRVFGTFGLGIIFFTISPELRHGLMDDVDGFQQAMVKYSPLSFIGVAVAILAVLMFALHRASQPRT